jgi:outer membrane receptor protein involved in Fe transport
MNFKKCFFLSLALLLAAVFAAPQLPAQTQTTGDIAGVVTDQTGGVVPQARVTLKDTAKGNTQDTQTNKDGQYRFFLLPPGSYTVAISVASFQPVSRTANVSIGQVVSLDVQLQVATSSTTVTVTETAPLLQTENGNEATTISEQQISEIPNPGNDLTAVAQLAPGSIMNTSSGLGNFSSFGISATANLFTLDGMDDNDPYLNLNNSGATNLALGTNEIQEATVVTNGYTGEYGSLAGANINYVTKSGGNQFHGNAIYYWNGRAMNANDWFNVASSTPRPFSNSNQWAGSFGGPIKKDKAFFFFNTEGLRVFLPTSFPVTFVPTQEFEAATITQLTNLGLTKSIPFYNQMFGLYNAAATGKNLTAIACPTDPVTKKDLFPVANCTQSYQGTASNLTHEAQYMGRVDYNFGARDRAFVRVAYDHGFQASITDPISPLFNVASDQPQWSAQFNETHTFGATTSNQFIASLLWYSALFGNVNQAATLAAFPTTIGFNDGTLTSLGGICCGGLGNSNFPQGRNVTQYQFSDDVSHTIGNHTLGFGVKFRRNDVSDHDFAVGNTGLIGEGSLLDYFNGGGTDSLTVTFPNAPVQPIALYTLGFYGQDQWRIKSNFSLTLSLRLEHQSNPVCQTDCFARFGPFIGADHNADVPYNQVLQTGLHQMLQGLDSIVWQPRIGFAWQPFGTSRQTVVRGGVGLFNDAFAGVLVDSIAGNSPNVNTFTSSNLPIAAAETVGGNLFAAAAADNAAFIQAFNSGGTVGSIHNQLGDAFNAPALSTFDRHSHIPQYQKYNLEIQHGFGPNTSIMVGYVGNHGIHEIIQNNSLNAFCDPTANSNPKQSACPGVAFVGLPSAAPDARFGTVTQYSSGGISNYNGLNTTFTHRFTGVLNGQASLNYLWGHAQDMASNGGITAIPFSFSNSFAVPTDPNNPRGSYGPADYDVRHNITANYVMQLPVRRALMGHGWASVVDGWQIAGTVFYHTGMPFTVFEGRETGLLRGNNYGGFIYPAVTGSGPTSCGESSAFAPCFAAGQFIAPDSSRAFTSGLRNAFRGPGYSDADFTLLKNTKLPGWERGTLGIGFQFYNVFNHPNFFTPVNSSSNSQFGLTQITTSSPTSILGAGLGGDSSPRIIQLKAQLSF